jgi:NAD(P)-dependent dehydrogenase (short-subunit alcohol dehydrogenase family)
MQESTRYEVPEQAGRRIVITGANSGTGLEATRRLVAAGAEVVMAVRSLAKGEAARDEVLAETPTARLEVRQLDLADLASVRAFAVAELADPRPLHVLVNNAGVMAPPERFETVDGFELQLGTNYLGPFALTELLLPKLLASGADGADAPRVVTMSSLVAGYGRIHLDDLNGVRRTYQPFREYGQSKLADLLLATQLATLAAERGWSLRSIGAHPGWTRTNLQTAGANLGRETQRQPTERAPFYTQEVDIGTEPLLHAIADPSATNGSYYGPRYRFVGRTRRVGLPLSARRSDPAALWAAAERLTGTSLPGA